MATKLKNLRVTSVSFVDKGANPRADILITKNQGQSAAVSAPSGDTSRDDAQLGILKRFMKWLKRGEEISEEEIEKEATSFSAQMHAADVEDVQSEIWDVTYALRQSLDSILTDTSLDSIAKEAAMSASLSQFGTAAGGFITKWSQGQTANPGEKAPAESSVVAMMRLDQERLGALIEKAEAAAPEPESPEPKGETLMNGIDKSKMTPEDLASFEALIKKYAVEPEPDHLGDDPGVAKAAEPKLVETEVPETPIEPEIVKALKAQIEETKASIAKMQDEALTNEMANVAKKYEVIGKKGEDLIPVLKSMKKAGDVVYNAYIEALDAEYDVQKSTGIMTEIGKSTSGSVSGDPTQRWIAKAQELRKSNPNLTMAKAMDQVALEDDELRAEIENQ